MSDKETKPLTTKQLYIKYLKGEATFEQVEASVTAFAATYNARYAARTAEATAKQPE